MTDSERDMLAYVQLAVLSQQKKQQAGRDRFLVLAAVAACREGWPAVAARCRALILEHNRSHLIGHFKTVAEALRSDDFQPFVKQLDRFCGSERAEFLLSELNMDPTQAARSSNTSAGDYALQLLSADK